jgi:hypothetical protein
MAQPPRARMLKLSLPGVDPSAIPMLKAEQVSQVPAECLDFLHNCGRVEDYGDLKLIIVQDGRHNFAILSIAGWVANGRLEHHASTTSIGRLHLTSGLPCRNGGKRKPHTQATYVRPRLVRSRLSHAPLAASSGKLARFTLLMTTFPSTSANPVPDAALHYRNALSLMAARTVLGRNFELQLRSLWTSVHLKVVMKREVVGCLTAEAGVNARYSGPGIMWRAQTR